MTKPKGKVEVIEFKPKEPNKMLAAADLVCIDEDGVLWTFSGCYMVSELHPYCANQTLDIGRWERELRNILPWMIQTVTCAMVEEMYRQGLTPEDAVANLIEVQNGK